MDFLLIIALIIFVLTRLGKRRRPGTPAGSTASGASASGRPSTAAPSEAAPTAQPASAETSLVGVLKSIIAAEAPAASEAPAPTAPAASAPAEGEHAPMTPSEEGAFSAQTQWIAQKNPTVAAKAAADPCRALPVDALGRNRAQRKAASIAVKRSVSPLKTDRAALTQGIYWAQVLETRGGHNRWNRSAAR